MLIQKNKEKNRRNKEENVIKEILDFNLFF